MSQRLPTAREIVSVLRNNAGALRELATLIGAELGVRQDRSHVYTSIALPPDVGNRRRFAEIVRRIPGAVRTGTVWSVERDTWWTYRRASTLPRFARPPSDDELAEQALTSAGYRRTR